MIRINFNKKYWIIKGHAPLYICYCITRALDLLAIEQNFFSKSNTSGFTKIKNSKTSLAKNVKFLLENMALQHPKHVRIENKNNFINVLFRKKEKLKK